MKDKQLTFKSLFHWGICCPPHSLC